MTQGLLELCSNEPTLSRHAYIREETLPQYAIMWNRGEQRRIIVDGVEYTFGEQMLVAFGQTQAFVLENAKDVVVWRYNRNFYCISDHDHEVSCIGLLFYGASDVMLLQTDAEEQRKFQLLYQVFVDEFRTHDSVQDDMLRTILKRLIIMLTRMAKTAIRSG